MKPAKALFGFVFLGAVATASCSSSNGDPCKPSDEDGFSGGPAVFERSIGDTDFVPPLTAVIHMQNLSDLTLEVTNVGTKPHGFFVDCKPTPNDDGCPTKSCFPPETNISSIEPGATTTVHVQAPAVEGDYPFHSDFAENPAESPYAVFDLD